MAISIPPVATGLDLQPPSFPHQQPKHQREFLPAARAFYPQQKIICSLWRSAFPSSCAAASPQGTERGLHPAPDPARGCSASPSWGSTATASSLCLCCSSWSGICLSHLSAPRFPPSPSVVLQLAAGRGCGPPPQGRPQCTRTGEGKCW